MQVTGQYLQLCSITSEQESKKSSGKRGERSDPHCCVTEDSDCSTVSDFLCDIFHFGLIQLFSSISVVIDAVCSLELSC